MERIGFKGITTNQSLLALVEAGRIDGDQAVAVSLKPNELAQALRGRSCLATAEHTHQKTDSDPCGEADHRQTAVPDFGLRSKATLPGVQLFCLHGLRSI